MKSAGNNNRKRVMWQDIMPTQPVNKAPLKTKSRREVKIVIPSVPIAKIAKSIKHHTTKTRRRKVALILFAFITVAIIVFVILYHPLPSQVSSETTPDGVTSAAKLVAGTPSYPVLLPPSKTVKNIGGLVRNDNQPSFVYTDKISSTQINVSEQPLPEDFKDDPNQQVATLAESLNATEKIDLGSMTIYIGTYSNNLQRVVFTKNNLLVLISANGTLTANQWATYVSALN